MSEHTKIPWATTTWQVSGGCQRVSEGCGDATGGGCYAEKFTHRLGHNPATPQYKGLTDDKGRWTGEVRLFPEQLEKPLHWKKPKRIFVNSMADLFHPAVPADFIHDVFDVMARCPQHEFYTLTKRPERMYEVLYGQDCPYLGGGDYYPNVLLGITAENQTRLEERIPYLLKCQPFRLFVSAEPLLSEVAPVYRALEILPWLDEISWVICGPENGPGARPMKLEWAADLRVQCQVSGTPFYYKGPEPGWPQELPCQK